MSNRGAPKHDFRCRTMEQSKKTRLVRFGNGATNTLQIMRNRCKIHPKINDKSMQNRCSQKWGKMMPKWPEMEPKLTQMELTCDQNPSQNHKKIVQKRSFDFGWFFFDFSSFFFAFGARACVSDHPPAIHPSPETPPVEAYAFTLCNFSRMRSFRYPSTSLFLVSWVSCFVSCILSRASPPQGTTPPGTSLSAKGGGGKVASRRLLLAPIFLIFLSHWRGVNNSCFLASFPNLENQRKIGRRASHDRFFCDLSFSV